MKELLDAWMASNFRAVLGLLDKFSVSAPKTVTSFRFVLSLLTRMDSFGDSGPSFARSPAWPARREPLCAHPRARNRALFPAVCYDPARAHERRVWVDGGRYRKGGRRAHPAGGHPRSRRQPEQNPQGALYEPPGTTVCPRAQGRSRNAGRDEQASPPSPAVCAPTHLITFTLTLCYSQQANLVVRKAQPPPAPTATAGASETAEQK